MAKRRSASNQLSIRPEQLPEYGELVSIMQNETASIVTDYIRQYVGVIQGNGYNVQGNPAIYMNQDRVQRFQTYQELAQFDLYAEVARDPIVKSILDSAKINVVEMDWDVYPYKARGEKKATARNQAIADFNKDLIDKITFFPQHMYELMDALGMGFSVSEIIWKIENNKVYIKDILNRPQRRFQFDAVDRSLRLRDLKEPYYGTALPDQKFIVHRCASQWSNPFGEPLLQSLYWMWLFKKTVLKFWMQHLQVGASSIPIVQHPVNANKELKGEALEIAKMIRNGAYGRLPSNFTLLWAEAKNALQNGESYHMFNRMADDQMKECVNGQTLTQSADSATGKGSRSLGDQHRLTQNSRDRYRAKGLSATLTATVIKWATDINFDKVEGYPVFKPELEESEDLLKESQIVKNITDSGFDILESELTEKFSYTITKKQSLNLKPNEDKSKTKVDENGNLIDQSEEQDNA